MKNPISDEIMIDWQDWEAKGEEEALLEFERFSGAIEIVPKPWCPNCEDGKLYLFPQRDENAMICYRCDTQIDGLDYPEKLEILRANER